MPYLVRKIARGKWPSSDILSFNVSDISADAISSCLRTSSNTLSTWEIDKIEDLEEAALALVSSAEHTDTMWVIFIEKSEITKNGLGINNTPGNTCVRDLVDRHIDVTGLTYKTIGDFAGFVLEALKQDQVKSFTSSTLKKMLKRAIEEDRINPDQLNPKLRARIGA